MNGGAEMQSFENIGKELERRGKTGEIKRLAQSADGQRLGQMVDSAAIEQAARNGDGAALSEMLKKILGTAEGQRLAEDVRRIMEE